MLNDEKKPKKKQEKITLKLVTSPMKHVS